MGRLRIAICGHGQCGKNTVSEWFENRTILRYTGSTSWYAAQEVFARMQELGIEYSSLEQCYEDRGTHRQIWADVIDQMHTEDKTILCRRCLEDQDVINGIRRRDELIASREAGLLDLIIWIDRDVPNDPTQDYGPEICDISVLNRQDKLALYRRLERLSKSLNIVKD